MTNLTYLFKIILFNGKILFLNSSERAQLIDDNLYYPHSGLNFERGEFNDSGENKITIYGIFESDGGINKNDNLSGAQIKIQYVYGDRINLIGNFIVTKYFSHDLEFELKCETECIKYNQPLLQVFSKSCRANFGDQRCKINLEEISIECIILEIKGNNIICNIEGFEDGFFNNGKVITQEREFKIISHYKNNIEINVNQDLNLNSHQLITLVPGCDKKYRTCCYLFNNAVNFRGEPVILEFNIIEN